MTRLRGQDGVATVLVLTVAVTLLALGAVGSTVAGAVLVRHRAALAADSAALAAAVDARSGQQPACLRAAALARANAARLVTCAVRGSVAEVTVAASPGGLLRWFPAVRLNARAGPADTYREKSAPVDGPS